MPDYNRFNHFYFNASPLAGGSKASQNVIKNVRMWLEYVVAPYNANQNQNMKTKTISYCSDR